MQCLRCQREAPADARFCPQCGTRLPTAASGAARTHTSRPGERIPDSLATLDGERKQVTVLFADLKGSMELLADRDPEEAQKLLDPIVEAMVEAVHRYDGTVSQVMGDGIMALFGAPLAHEDHAVRACYAALRMQESVTRHGDEMQRSHGAPVQIRVGLNSGEVVLRSLEAGLHLTYAAVGQTVHLAARMEQMAKPGSVLATVDTVRLAEPYVEVRALGPVNVRGLETPVEVYEVTGTGAARSRLQAAAARGLTRFVGREVELAQLAAVLERVRAGGSEIVAVVGEAGVGKSRLFHEFLQAHRGEGLLTIESGSMAAGSASAYRPGIELLRRYFGIDSGDEPAVAREKVAARMRAAERDVEELLPPVLASMLMLPRSHPFWSLEAGERRRRALDAIIQMLQYETAIQPIVLVFEDLHWADANTLAFLDGLVQRLPAATLLLVNYRIDHDDGWQDRPNYTRLRMDPLSPRTADDLVTALVGPAPELTALKRRLVERTDGNPFFIEECVRNLREAHALLGPPGDCRLAVSTTAIEIPATVQTVLASRIDRLPGEAKRLLQCAAVIGEDVPIALLHAIADLPEDALRRALARLQAADLLVETRLVPEPEYHFKHSLTHGVAYDGLLHERRRHLHAAIVEAMERLYADRLGEHVERLGHHAFRGEAWAEAVGYLHQAGVQSLAHFAGQDAVASFERALLALAHLPDTPANREAGIDIRLDLRNALLPFGHHAEIFGHLREAQRLADALGDERRLGRILAFLSNHYWNIGEADLAVDAGQRALAIAERGEDLHLQIVGYFSMGGSLRALGDYRMAVEFMRQVVGRLDRELAYEFFGQHGLPSVLARSHLVWSLAEMGDFAEAVATAEEAVSIAETARHAYTLSHAYLGLGGVLVRQGSFHAAIPVLERGILFSERAPLLFPPLAADLGLACARTGRLSRGLALLRQAVERATALGRRGRLPLMLSHLAEIELLAGQRAEAEARAASALALAVSQKERGNQVYALRLLGELAAGEDPPAAVAAARYDEAIALAHELGMRPLRARCELGLGELATRGGQPREAREHLALAAAQFRDMAMPYWLERAEAALRAAARARRGAG